MATGLHPGGSRQAMSKRKKKSGETPVQTHAAPASGAPRDPARTILWALVAGLLVMNFVTLAALGRRTRQKPGPLPHAAEHGSIQTSPLRDFAVVNAHEHVYKKSHLDNYFAAAEKTGIVKTLFVASSAFTLLGQGHAPDEMTDWSSEEVLRIARAFPGRVTPFCTIHPGDPAALDKVKKYAAEGAVGLKLYTGHGSFHDRPLDALEMLPIYAYCQETGLPICWHVNLMRYANEFERVMARFPGLTVIIPHFGVAFYRPTGKPFHRLEKLLDAYPNLYTDTSLGTRSILVHGLEMVSEYRDVFRAFCDRYSDRILFGTDMVVTGNSEKTSAWIEAVILACRNMLEKDTYVFSFAARGSPYAYAPAQNTYGILHGLALSDEVLRKIYETNFDKVFAQKSPPP